MKKNTKATKKVKQATHKQPPFSINISSKFKDQPLKPSRTNLLPFTFLLPLFNIHLTFLSLSLSLSLRWLCFELVCLHNHPLSNMGFLHRKLLESNSTLPESCPPSCLRNNFSVYCLQPCLYFCQEAQEICTSYLMPPPSPPSSLNDQTEKSNKIPPSLIATGTVLAAAFLIVCCYAIYTRYYLRRRDSRMRSQPQIQETQDEFSDQGDGPVVDHPIWYIRTLGLQQSVINSIRVCKYRSGDGLVEGTECSVCLSEFQEDETLRLLPKCSHAFHIPCIDTWLRSHTNCPMCRAPIIETTVRTPLPEPAVDNFGRDEETQVEISQSSGSSDRDLEDEVQELRIGIDVEGGSVAENGEKGDIQPLRRSVSLDSLSASRISLAVANIVPVDSAGNSDTQLVKVKESNTRIVANRVEGNQSLLRLLGSSSKGRSVPSRPVAMKRSVSWSGKFKLCNNSQSRNLVLRSF